MGRPAYKLTKRDASIARQYIERAMERGDVSRSEGYNAFRRAADAEALQAWCDDYLPRDVWTRLLGNIRQQRKRSRDYGKHKITRVDLTRAAWIHLSAVAREMGNVTLSEAILRMEAGYYKAKDAKLI